MITNYTDLQLSIARWLNREGDAAIAAQIPEFIQIAEAQIQRRVRRKTLRASVILSSAEYSLPSDVGELRTVRLVTGLPGIDGGLRPRTVAQLNELRTTRITAGYPRWFSHVGDQLLLVPAPAALLNAELTYYEKLVPLSASVSTNSVLQDAPDIYLFGALKEAEPYLENDERVATWAAKFEAACNELTIARDNEEYSEGVRSARLPIVF